MKNLIKKRRSLLFLGLMIGIASVFTACGDDTKTGLTEAPGKATLAANTSDEVPLGTTTKTVECRPHKKRE